MSDDKRRNLILGASTPSQSVIIKATRDKDYRPRDAEAFASGMVREWMATAFLAEHAPGHAPAFLAGDAEPGLIVMQYLGAGSVRCCVARPKPPKRRWWPMRGRSGSSTPR